MRSLALDPSDVAFARAYAVATGTKLRWVPNTREMGSLVFHGRTAEVTSSGNLEEWVNNANPTKNALQPILVNRPAILANEANGLPGLGFTNAHHLFAAGLSGSFRNAPGVTVIAVVKKVLNLQLDSLFECASGAGGTRFQVAWDAANKFRIGGRRLDADGFTTLTDAAASGSAYSVYTGVGNFGANTGLIRINGTQKASSATMFSSAGNTSDTDSSNVAIGAYHDGTANLLEATLIELVVFNAALSAPDIEKVEGYVAWAAGIQASLDVGHAYKIAAPTA